MRGRKLLLTIPAISNLIVCSHHEGSVVTSNIGCMVSTTVKCSNYQQSTATHFRWTNRHSFVVYTISTKGRGAEDIVRGFITIHRRANCTKNCFLPKMQIIVFAKDWNLFVLIASWRRGNMPYLFFSELSLCFISPPPTHCFCLGLLAIHQVSNRKLFRIDYFHRFLLLPSSQHPWHVTGINN